jgi:hypothetical protein
MGIVLPHVPRLTMVDVQAILGAALNTAMIISIKNG